ILKNLNDEIVRDKEFIELDTCSEYDKKIIMHNYELLTILSCAHVYHRYCIEKKLSRIYPNICPMSDCNKPVKPVISVDISREDSSNPAPSKKHASEPTSANKSTGKKAKKESHVLNELIKELSTEPETPQAPIVRKENAVNFDDLYNNITNAETQNEIMNQDLITCYYLFGKALSEQLEHHKKSNPPYASLLLVNEEVKEQIPNITDTTLWKKVERSRKIYKLFLNIGEDKIQRVRSFSALTISKLRKEDIDSIILTILKPKNQSTAPVT
ncbi:4921_t:CDS:1, partial [Scutellospora calospora]